MSNAAIEISESAREFAERKAREAGLGSPGAYLETLIARARRRDAVRANLERLLIEGLNSGPSKPFTPEDWDAMRQRLRDRLAAPVKS